MHGTKCDLPLGKWFYKQDLTSWDLKVKLQLLLPKKKKKKKEEEEEEKKEKDKASKG